MGIEPGEDFVEVGFGEGGAAGSGDVFALPEVEEDAGAEAGLVVRIVGDLGAQLVAAYAGNHCFWAGPITGYDAVIDDLIVVA